MLWAYIQIVACLVVEARIVEVGRATLRGTAHRPVTETGLPSKRETDGNVTGHTMEGQSREQQRDGTISISHTCPKDQPIGQS